MLLRLLMIVLMLKPDCRWCFRNHWIDATLSIFSLLIFLIFDLVTSRNFCRPWWTVFIVNAGFRSLIIIITATTIVAASANVNTKHLGADNHSMEELAMEHVRLLIGSLITNKSQFSGQCYVQMIRIIICVTADLAYYFNPFTFFRSVVTFSLLSLFEYFVKWIWLLLTFPKQYFIWYRMIPHPLYSTH